MKTSPDMKAIATAAKQAARVLASADSKRKDQALLNMAAGLRAHSKAILKANALDVAEAKKTKDDAFIDRLTLTAARIEGMARAIDDIVKLDDPIGEVTETRRRPNGLEIRKVRLPLGVVMMVYEARPNVTSDAAALCLKSGNASILRGGSESFRSNQAIAKVLQKAVTAAGLPAETVTLVPTTDRASMLELLKLDGLIDLCIPRGGPGLIHFVAENARVPVVKHYQGICHVYLHADADLKMAEAIVLNAKTSRPGVCNAAECLLIDAANAQALLVPVAKALVSKGVQLRVCETSRAILKKARVKHVAAQADDFGQEFLNLTMAVKVVDGLDGALAHIAHYGSEHTEAIVTRSRDAARAFTREVTSSAVMVNASTRFNDGGELGLGAEIGISTSRVHAFGAMGLKELTSQRYIVEGDGQIR